MLSNGFIMFAENHTEMS